MNPNQVINHSREMVSNLAFAIHRGSFVRPQALYLLAIPAVVLLWSLFSVREFKQILSRLIRALALALFVLALAEPQKVVSTTGATRPAVVDVSASITPAMRSWESALIRDGLKLRPSDPAILFATGSVPATVKNALEVLGNPSGCIACGPSATNLETALAGLAASPAARGGPAVLLTDGWQNRGDAGHAITQLLAAGVRLYIFTPPGAGAVPNVAMTELTLPSALSKSAPFALGVTMRNLNGVPVDGTIQVYRNGTLLTHRVVKLAPGEQRFDFPVTTETAGLDSYQVSFKADNPALDTYQEDDSLQGWVGVGSRRKILILTDRDRDAIYVQTVIQRLGFEAVVVVPSGEWNGVLKEYDAVILDNLPREHLSAAAQSAIVYYIQRGGSLAMVGGDESFGLGGYQGTPIAAAMPVIMKPPQHKQRQRALILIIDKSGSMMRDHKLEYAKAAAETVTKSLKDSDLISVIGFDTQPFVVVPMGTLAQARPYFNQLIDRLKPEGGTFLMPALKQAEREMADTSADVKHVVILTDGLTGGTPDMYYSLVASMHHELGTSISAIAIGDEANTPLLASIAKYGGGGFYQTDSPSNLPEIFLSDFRQHGGETTMVESDFRPQTTNPNPVLKDYAGRALPTLKGYVRTVLKPQATLDAYVNREDHRDPVIASWDYGEGKVLAVTTDASGRWSGNWISDDVFAPLWNRMLAWLTPEKKAERQFDIALGYQNGRIHLKLIDYSYQPGTGSQIIDAMVKRPDGTKYETSLNLEVPGELSASLDAPLAGTYYIEARSSDKNSPYPPLAYTVSPAVDAELPRPDPNYGLLERLASATGGRLNPSVSDLELTRPTIERRESLDPLLILAAMVLLIGEAFVRRLTL